jgi:hypothetical protein
MSGLCQKRTYATAKGHVRFTHRCAVASPTGCRVRGEADAAVPIALPAEAALPVDWLLARLQSVPCACARCTPPCSDVSHCSHRAAGNCRYCRSAMRLTMPPCSSPAVARFIRR